MLRPWERKRPDELDEHVLRRNMDWFETTFLPRIRNDDPQLVRIRPVYLKPGVQGDEVAISIAEALRFNRHVRVVDLSELGLSHLGVMAVASALRDNNTVEEIDLSGNNVGADEEGVSALKSVVCREGTAVHGRRVVLRRMGLSPESAKALLLAAARGYSVKNVVLEEPDNIFRPDALSSLVDELRTCASHTLGVSGVSHTIPRADEHGFVSFEVAFKRRYPSVVLYNDRLQKLCKDASAECTASIRQKVSDWVDEFTLHFPWLAVAGEAKKSSSGGWNPLQIQISGLLGSTHPDVAQVLIPLLPEVPQRAAPSSSEIRRYKPPKNALTFSKGPLLVLIKEAKRGYRPWPEVMAWVDTFPSLASVQAQKHGRYGVTPLYRLVGARHVPLDVFQRILALAPEMARVRKKYWRARVNGNLPLHRVAMLDVPDANTIETMKCLIQAYPAALASRNSLGRNPLQCAQHAWNWELVTMLLEETSNKEDQIKMVDGNGSTALHVAARRQAPTEVLRVIIETNPALLFVADSHGRSPMYYLSSWHRAEQALDIAHRYAFEADENGNLLLHCAVRAGMDWKSIRQIVRLNPDAVTTRDSEGFVPFMLAADTTVAFRLLLTRPDVIGL